MRSSHRRDSRDRIAEIARLIDHEQIDQAARALTKGNFPASLQFEAELLQARILLIRRSYKELRTHLAALRGRVRGGEDERELTLLDAHMQALTGRARGAFRRVVNILRRSAPLGEARARARWIAGVSCYRTGHYRWARTLTEQSAAYYRLAGKIPQLANVLVNLALIAKSEGDESSPLLVENLHGSDG